MPSQILHTLFGEDVIEGLFLRLNEPALKIPADCHGAFALGCQGPDIFYHNRRTRPSALEYGALLHRRGYGAFSGILLETALPAGGDLRIGALGFYALGFMTHAMLDRACHPYIIYKSSGLGAGNRSEEILYHPFFERIIDVLMLDYLRHKKTDAWDHEAFCEISKNSPEGLKEMLAACLAKAFPERAGKDKKLALRIKNAFADSASFYSAISPAYVPSARESMAGHNVSRRFLSIMFPQNLPQGIDFLNLSKKEWYYPYAPALNPAAPDTRSFPEIYSQAVEKAVSALAPCFSRYFGSGAFPTSLAAEIIGGGGLSIQNEDGAPCAPNLAAPLPLDDVLQEQVALAGQLA